MKMVTDSTNVLGRIGTVLLITVYFQTERGET